MDGGGVEGWGGAALEVSQTGSPAWLESQGAEKAEWEALLSWYPAAANITVRRDIWAGRKR